MYLLQNFLSLHGLNEDGFPMEDDSVFNIYGILVVPVGSQGLWDIIGVLRPVIDDCFSKGSQQWVSPGEFLMDALRVFPICTWQMVTSISMSFRVSGVYLERVSANNISFPGQYTIMQS